jgi:hypothetical protein
MADIDLSELSSPVVSLGKLLGLLTVGNAGSATVNTDWFENPILYLESIPNRLQDAVDIVSGLLTLSSSNPTVFTDAQWYQIPNLTSGMGTPFYIVLPKTGDTSGEIGLGVMTASGGDTVVDIYLYIPLFSFSSSGVEFIAASTDHPTQFGLNAKAPADDPFAVTDGDNTIQFSEFDVLIDLFLADQAPSGQVIFQNLTGTKDPNTYTTFSSLINSGDVLTWIGEVLVQCSDWLTVYVANTPYTVGDFLEAANFLTRNYLVVGSTLPDVGNFAVTLNQKADPVTDYLWSVMPTADQQVIADANSTEGELTDALVDALNAVIQNGQSIYTDNRFASVLLSPQTDALLTQNPQSPAGIIHLNRLLLQDAYPAYLFPNAFELNIKNVTGTGEQIALNFVFAILNTLAQLEIPLIYLPQGGIYIVEQQNSDSSSDYGIRFAFAMTLDSSPNQSNQPPSPEVDLCIGAWMTGETDSSNWYTMTTNTGAEAGLSLFGLHRAADQTLSFVPSFDMNSVGINIKGGGNAPLINLQGYSLGGVELRFSLGMENWSYGLAARLDNVGFPLAPPFNQTNSGSGNLVAQNLLAGDSGGSSSADPTQANTTNPAFSAEVAYVKGYPPLLQIYDAQGQKTDLIWFPIQKRFGPLDVSKIGLRIDVTGNYAGNPLLGLVFDGGVTLAGLALAVDQLEINMELKQITDASGYSFDLQGLSLYFNEGGVEISGGLVKNTANTPVSYDGEAIIKVEDFGITALGSYSALPDGSGTSLFVFALINAPLGGPGFFFVTGLAFGFGYNRALRLPTQSEITQFPLVSGLTNPAALGNTLDPATVLKTFDQWVPVERGEYWVAAGIQFTTYEIVNTNALLVVQFGQKFSIALIGIAILKQLPTGGDTTYVYAELDLEVIFDPSVGEFIASASLAASSYVLSQDAHLTGGFAFYAWFGSNAHAGDFVFTLGGYHPAFIVPAYYPQVGRVGINWKVSDKISVTGGAYFAITPTAMMAGANMSLVFQAGALKAWLIAVLDAILYFKPFYMDVLVSISVGVSYRLHLGFIDKTLAVELGASVHLWGPHVGGLAKITWYIISFSIGFGADPNPPTTLSWDDFKGLLPSKTTTNGTAQPLAAVGDSPDTTTTTAYLSITANGGLLSTQQVDSMTFWLVRAGDFTFTASSALPASQIIVTEDTSITGQPVGVQRLNGGIALADYVSTQTLTIVNMTDPNLTSVDAFVKAVDACLASDQPNLPTDCAYPPVDMTGWTATAVTSNLPQAIYGDPTQNPNGLNPNPPNTTVTGTTGITLFPTPTTPTNGTPELSIDQIFVGRTLNPNQEALLPLSQTSVPVVNMPLEVNSFLDIATINDEGVEAARSAVFVALQQLNVNGWVNNPLPQMAAAPGTDFADEPLEAAPIAGS